MKLTLLQITQSILSSLGSDEVNSISDTTESLQVADIVRQTYMNMIGKYDMPEHNQLFQLQASDSLSAPVLMTVPSGVTKISWLKYLDTNPADNSSFQVDQYGAYSEHDTNTDLESNANGWSTQSLTSVAIALGSITFTVGSGLSINVGDNAFCIPEASQSSYMSGTVTSYVGTTLILNITNISGSGTYNVWNISQVGGVSGPVYKQIKIIPVQDFIVMVNSFNPAEMDINTFQFQTLQNDSGLPMSFQFYYKNDLQPQYCCIIADKYVIFDAYDSTQDSTLQTSKTMAYGWVYPPFVMSDTWVAPFEDQVFPLFVNDAKSLAFFELKQMPHQKADKETNQQRTAWQKFKATANRPTYFGELPNYGRRWSGRYWGDFL